MKARLAFLATLCVAVFLNACGDPTSLRATLPIAVDTLLVYALTGTPPSYPSGVSIVSTQAVRIDGFAGFDVALDLYANGSAVVYSGKLVVASPGTARPVGLQKVASSFDAVLEAPSTGYTTDAKVVLAP